MEQYNVTGMSCAACSARVEKAVKKVPGVASCSVSLLTNSMGVEGTAIRRRDHQGRAGCRLRCQPQKDGDAAAASPPAPTLTRWPTTRPPSSSGGSLRRWAFCSVLMYFSMGHMMWGWPLPPLVRRQPHRHGPCAAAAGGHRHGHQPEVLHQRLQRGSSTARPTWIRWWPWAPWQALCGAPTPCSP